PVSLHERGDYPLRRGAEAPGPSRERPGDPEDAVFRGESRQFAQTRPPSGASPPPAHDQFLSMQCWPLIQRTVRERDRITTEWVVYWREPGITLTPSSMEPSVTPVAAKITSPRAMSSVEYLRSKSVMPQRMARARSSSLRNRSRPWIWPPMARRAAAASTPSGAPPEPMYMSTPVVGSVVAITPATSPSPISMMRAPASRTALMGSAWRGPSSMQTLMASGVPPLALPTPPTLHC